MTAEHRQSFEFKTREEGIFTRIIDGQPGLIFELDGVQYELVHNLGGYDELEVKFNVQREDGTWEEVEKTVRLRKLVELSKTKQPRIIYDPRKTG